MTSCTICGDDTPLTDGQCRRCHRYLQRRQTSEARRDAAPQPLTLNERIEVEIAKGSLTADIMSQLAVDYSAVKAVRDAMEQAS